MFWSSWLGLDDKSYYINITSAVNWQSFYLAIYPNPWCPQTAPHEFLINQWVMLYPTSKTAWSIFPGVHLFIKPLEPAYMKLGLFVDTATTKGPYRTKNYYTFYLLSFLCLTTDDTEPFSFIVLFVAEHIGLPRPV